MNRFFGACLLILLFFSASSDAVIATDYDSLVVQDGTVVEFATALPPGYESGTPAPVMLALPPGPQSKPAVAQSLRGYWADEAGKRGWVVVSPAAINGMLYFRGAERVIPELLDLIVETYKPPGGKVHLASISNGGLSAFHIALRQPDRFSSLAVYAGFPPECDSWRNLTALRDLRIATYVGEEDASWKENMDLLKSAFDNLGIGAHYEILPGVGHVLRPLKGAGAARVFEVIAD
jgi:S-formylglutathione hydrolase FrmB